MADPEKERPSLEPPKLFGRRGRRDDAEPTETTEPSDTVPEPEEEPLPEPEPTPEPEPDPTVPVPVADADPEPAFEDAGSAADTAVLAAAAASIDERDTRTSSRSPKRERTPKPAKPEKPAKKPKAAKPAKPAEQKKAADTRDDATPAARRSLALDGRIAAVVAGLVVGLVLVGLTWGAFRGCEAVQGADSCGTGPGLVLLLLVFALSILLGRYLLGFFSVPDPLSTSFLATGLTALVAMLFLIDQLDHWSMIIVIPAISAVSFLLSWWMTTTFVNEASDVPR